MRLNRSYLSIGPGLILTFAVLVCLILAGNGLLIWQFRIAGRHTDRLSGANQQVIAVLRLQEQLLYFHQRLTALVEEEQPQRVANGIEPMRQSLLDQIGQTRNTVEHLPEGTRVDPAFLPTLDAISIDLPSQLDAITALARLGAWEVLRTRLTNVMRVMESQIELLVRSIDAEANQELSETQQSMRKVQRRILTMVPMMAVSTFLTAAFFAWAITRRMLELRLEERIEERTRIAGELHDNLLQSIISAKMLVQLSLDQLPQGMTPPPTLARISEIMERAIREGRNTIQGFRFHFADEQDMGVAFSRVLDELRKDREIDCRVSVRGRPARLRAVVRNELYSIGREALMNSFRHSGGGTIEIVLEYSRILRMLVRDDGCGMDTHLLQHGRDGHFGLAGMRERAHRIGATFEICSHSGGGTEIQLSLPGRIAYDRRT